MLDTPQKAFDEKKYCFRCKTEHKNEIDRMVLMNKIMNMAKSDLSFEEKQMQIDNILDREFSGASIETL